MEDFELLDKLTTAYKENNKDEFTRLCCSDCQNGSDYNNFYSLNVLRSHITENDDTFIEHLKKYMTDEEEKCKIYRHKIVGQTILVIKALFS